MCQTLYKKHLILILLTVLRGNPDYPVFAVEQSECAEINSLKGTQSEVAKLGFEPRSP